MNKNLYEKKCREILGVSANASVKEIKAAYRKLAKKYHPDVCSDKDATGKFSEIHDAYEYLISISNGDFAFESEEIRRYKENINNDVVNHEDFDEYRNKTNYKNFDDNNLNSNKKVKNTIIGFTILFVMFLSYAGQLETARRNAGVEIGVRQTACQDAFLNVLLNVICIALIPFSIKIFDSDKYYNKTKYIYIVNAVIWVFLSIPVSNYIYNIDGSGIGLLGSIIYSIAVYNLLK